MTDSTPVVPKQGFVLGNKLYDKLKFTVQVVLPGIGTLYAALAGFWGFPHAQEVVGSIAALALFLGLLLGQSAKNFVAPPVTGTPVGGFVVGKTEDGKTYFRLDLDEDPQNFISDDVVSFHVNREENMEHPMEDQVPREENTL